MSFSNVEDSLTEAAKKFDEIVSRRERLIKESREVIALSAKAIVNVHTSEFAEAKKLRAESRAKLDELRVVAGVGPDKIPHYPRTRVCRMFSPTGDQGRLEDTFSKATRCFPSFIYSWTA